MYNILKYDTAVNLSEPIKGNLVEIEFALKQNATNFPSAAFNVVSFYDQARDTERSDSYATGDGAQAPWSGTGVALLEQSAYAVPEEITDDLLATTPISTSFDGEKVEQNTGKIATVDNAFTDALSILGDDALDALIMSNHGGSFLIGFNTDGPDYDNDPEFSALSVPELSDSINNLTNASGLGLLAFDECLMANIETVYELAPDARYIVASQPTIPGTGYEYFDTLSNFSGTTADPSKDLGLTFVQNYQGKYPAEDPNRAGASSLSLTDTAKLDGLVAELADFVTHFNAMSDEYVSAFMSNLVFYGTKYDADAGYDFLQDMGVVALIAKQTVGGSEALKATSDAIIQQLDQTILATANGFDPAEGFERFGSSGLTVTIPLAPRSPGEMEQFIAGYKQAAPRFEAETAWSTLIEKTQTASSVVIPSSVYGDSVSPEVAYGLIEAKQGGEFNALLDAERFLKDGGIEDNVVYSLDSAQLSDIQLKDVNLIFEFAVLEPGTFGIIFDGYVITVPFEEPAPAVFYDFSIDRLGLPDDQREILGNKTLADVGEITVFADDQIQYVYDLTLRADNHAFVPNVAGIHSKDNPLLMGYADVINFAIDPGNTYQSYFELPVLPDSPNDADTLGERDIAFVVRPSDKNAPYEFTVGAAQDSGDEAVTFTGVGDLKVPIRLSGPQEYYKKIIYTGTSDGPAVDTAIEIARVSDSRIGDTGPVVDYGAEQIGVNLYNWGQMLDESIARATVFKPGDGEIRGLSDLSEGQTLMGEITQWQRAGEGSDDPVYSADGSLQFASAGLWLSEADAMVSVSVQGVASRQAELGFFELEGPNNAIARPTGGFSRPGDADYTELALANLVDINGQAGKLLDLGSGTRDLSGGFVFEADTYYAALLMVAGPGGNDTPMFSISEANEGGKTQMVPFGDDLYGYEDLIEGVDSGYDGDFNDVVFMMA